MQDPTSGHGPPAVTTAFGFAAMLVVDDAARLLALLIALVGLWVSVVRLSWDWQDRRTRLAREAGAAAERRRRRTDQP